MPAGVLKGEMPSVTCITVQHYVDHILVTWPIVYTALLKNMDYTTTARLSLWSTGLGWANYVVGSDHSASRSVAVVIYHRVGRLYM